MKKENLIALTLFSVSMGLLESAVVVYLRKLLYGGGFDFPLQAIHDQAIGLTELLRETATVIMLMMISYIYGKSFISRFAAFLFSFAIWDIFYYAFLKMLIGWPDSMFTWDVLFLIPLTWVGPVLSPVIVSCTMILYAFVFWKRDTQHVNASAHKLEWIGFLTGATIIFISFIYDPLIHVMREQAFREAFNLNGDGLMKWMSIYIPERFNWLIFGLGELVLLLSIFKYAIRLKPRLSDTKPLHS